MIDSDLYLLVGPVAPPRAIGKPRQILLTGATGFVGSHILSTLIDRIDAHVHCLVRAADAAAGLARLQSSLARFGLATDRLAARVSVETGQIDAPRLGLADKRWRALADRVDGIVHGAAKLHFLSSYVALRPHNVDATRQILQLTSESGARLLHLSTINAAMTTVDCGRTRVLESDPPPPISAIGGAYNRTKWVGERLVEMGAASGVQAAILRLGWVIGDARRGAIAEDQVQHRAAAAAVRAGVALLPAGAMDLVPVEYVAACVVALLVAPECSGIYHLVHPTPLYADAMAATVAVGWPRMRTMPVAEWVRMMRELARDDDGHPLRPLLMMRRPVTGITELVSRMPAFDSRRTQEVIAGQGIGLPATGVDQLARMLGHPTPRA